MPELLQSRGIFSGENLPKGFTSKKFDSEVYMQPLGFICPDMRVLSQISRGANSTTFVLKNSSGLRICQFSASTKSNFNPDSAYFQERQASSRFSDAQKRMAYLRSRGIAVPNILSSGKVFVAGELKEYIIMDFIKGVSVDTFLSAHSHKNEEVHEKMGRLLAQLREVPLKNTPDSADDRVLNKVRGAGDYLVQKQIITLEHIQRLVSTLDRRLCLLGASQSCYVHLDPFPVNIQVTGSCNNFALTLLDVEAINEGHPLVEGLGRALEWGIYDWSYVSGISSDVSSTANAFLRGYSQFSPSAMKYMQNPEKLTLLLETTELVSLPLSIMKESKKDDPGEYYEWSKNRLLELIEK